MQATQGQKRHAQGVQGLGEEKYDINIL